MKTRIVHLIIGLLMISSLKGQIKIGDNPQTLDPSSVLELESTSRVLVITRVTDAQMNTIAPLRGALVYNIDQGCIHYYDGTDWVNICEALDNSFTVSTEAVFNQFSRDSTVVVTQTDDNYNFEVNLITGDNIVPTSINGDVHIQPSSITGGLLQDATISFDKLADGENTGEVLQWNGNEWILVDETGLVVTEVDGEIGNEVLDATAGGSLVRSGAGTDVDPFTLDVTDGGIDNAELATDAVTTDKIQDGDVNTNDIANLAVTNIKLDKANIPLSGFGPAATNIDLGNNVVSNVQNPVLPQDAATKNYVDAEIIASTQTIVSADAGNSITASGTDGGAFYDDSTLQTSITINTADIGTNQTNIATNATNITANATNLANHIAADLDTDNTNEIQDLQDVIGQDASAGNQAITNLADPTNAQDAATKAYVDNEITSSNQTIVSTDSGNLITASGTDGGAFYDGDFTNLINVPLGLADGDDDTNTTNSSLTQDGTNLILTDSDTNTVTIPLSQIDTDTNTTNSSLTQDGTNLILTDSDTNTVTIPLSQIDTDTNTTNSSLTQDGTNLILTDSDTNTVTIPLSQIDSDTNTTNSSLTQDGTNLILTDSDTNTVTIPLSQIDSDTNTTNSSLTQDGTNLILTDSDTNTVTIPLSQIDTDTNTTNSSLTQDGTNLILTDSDTNTVTIPLSQIDAQDLSRTQNTLSVSGGATTIDLGIKPIATLTSNTTLDNTHYTVILNAGISTLTLPTAASSTGRVYFIKNISGALVNTSNYQDLSNSTIGNIPNNSTITLQSDGTNWQQIN